MSEKSDANRLMCIFNVYTFYPPKMMANILHLGGHAPWNDHAVFVRFLLSFSSLPHCLASYSSSHSVFVFFSFYPFIMHLFICFSRFVSLYARNCVDAIFRWQQPVQEQDRHKHIGQTNENCLQKNKNPTLSRA